MAEKFKISNLDLYYGDFHALKNINMSIASNEITAFIGPSGCGKTTLLRLIGGQLKPVKGEVKVDGEVVHEQGRERLFNLRRKMGMLFQFGALFTDLSVYENVAFPIREHTDLPESMIRDFVMLKLNAVGLRGAHNLMPTELSGGMARRVALARAVAAEPHVLVLDDPLSALDVDTEALVEDALRTVLKTTTALIVAHRPSTVRLADKVALLENGRITAYGKHSDLLASSAHYRYVISSLDEESGTAGNLSNQKAVN